MQYKQAFHYKHLYSASSSGATQTTFIRYKKFQYEFRKIPALLINDLITSSADKRNVYNSCVLANY